jgi:hypothetical protein
LVRALETGKSVWQSDGIFADASDCWVLRQRNRSDWVVASRVGETVAQRLILPSYGYELEGSGWGRDFTGAWFLGPAIVYLDGSTLSVFRHSLSCP